MNTTPKIVTRQDLLNARQDMLLCAISYRVWQRTLASKNKEAASVPHFSHSTLMKKMFYFRKEAERAIKVVEDWLVERKVDQAWREQSSFFAGDSYPADISDAQDMMA